MVTQDLCGSGSQSRDLKTGTVEMLVWCDPIFLAQSICYLIAAGKPSWKEVKVSIWSLDEDNTSIIQHEGENSCEE